MSNNILPIILLKGSILFPHCELRVEFNNESDKRVIEQAEKEYNGEVLVVSPINPIEEEINVSNLPKIATLAKIKLKMDLNNQTTRVVLEGKIRVNISEYYLKEETEIFRAKFENTTNFILNSKDEAVLNRKIISEVEKFISRVPYMSNSILSQLQQEKSISKVTDLVANYLPSSFERKLEYLKTINPYTRVIMLLESIKAEEEILQIEEKIETELKKQLDESQKEYILREKIRIIKEELGDISVKDNDVEEIRNKINNLKCNNKRKEKLFYELKKYEMANQNSPEISTMRTYIDWMISLPWNTYTKDEIDLKKAKSILDTSHYGLEKVKMRIIEFLSVRKISNNIKSPIICLAGPPGVGKTTLARSIAKSINRRFVKISVGGVSDEAEIIGHRRTYVGANPGRIITAMKKAKVSNPVFLIDEIDKMSKDYKGDPASALLEVLDKEQNKYFKDNFIEEEYDLSNVMFILTANEIYHIPNALRDRLEIIELSGYTEYEKLDIAKRHLIPRELKEHGLKQNRITFEDDAILCIIRNYTKEAGVRDLERNIASIIRKIIVDIVNNNNNTSSNFIISEEELKKHLGNKKYFYSESNKKDEIGVAIGLAYTEFGGDVLPIEVTFYKGKGELKLTGSLGAVMKESAQIALSYIKSHCSEFDISYEKIENSDIHIHVPEGAIPKDGPSAGITLTTALISAFTNKPVNSETGMTGEITLRGNVLPIGGLKEKALGANRSGLKRVIIPKENEKDLEEIPNEIKNNLQFITVENYSEVYKIIYN